MNLEVWEMLWNYLGKDNKQQELLKNAIIKPLNTHIITKVALYD